LQANPQAHVPREILGLAVLATAADPRPTKND